MNSDVVAQLRTLFAPESRGDPLASFPSLTTEGHAYNVWLTRRVLEPVLGAWLARSGRAAESGGMMADEIARGSASARGAFRELLPAAMAAGDPAVLAAMAVTANLQRTLGILAEHLLAGGRLIDDSPAADPAFRLSRLWCGLVEYPPLSAYFAAPMRAPLHPGRLQPNRRDPRHLANALWCSLAAINENCDAAIAVLREAILRSGLYSIDDGGPRRVPGGGPPLR